MKEEDFKLSDKIDTRTNWKNKSKDFILVKDVKEFINIPYDDFKVLREEWKKKPKAFPQDRDFSIGIRQDFSLFKFILNKRAGKI